MPEPLILPEIVRPGLCVACGACAAACPADALSVELTDEGTYAARLGDGCTECGLCSRLCPQRRVPEWTGAWRADAPETALLTGDPPRDDESIRGFAGHLRDESARRRSASGGLLTACLHHLLRSDEVDAAVVVDRSGAAGAPWFRATVARTHGEIDAAASTKYYPVEFSRVLRDLARTGERAAVVALPCQARGLRTLAETVPAWRERLPWILGLTCGHGTGTALAETLAGLAGAAPGPGDRVSFRSSREAADALDYAFRVEREGRTAGRAVPFRGAFGELWAARTGVPRVCDLCGDVFAQAAEAVFMDAWLPDFIGDPRGTSLVLTRSDRSAALLEALAAEEMAEIAPVSVETIVESQRNVVRWKRQAIAGRVAAALETVGRVPAGYGALADGGTPAGGDAFRLGERRRRKVRLLRRLPLPLRWRARLTHAWAAVGVKGALRRLLRRSG